MGTPLLAAGPHCQPNSFWLVSATKVAGVPAACSGVSSIIKPFTEGLMLLTVACATPFASVVTEFTYLDPALLLTSQPQLLGPGEATPD
jgi:hypothetical protein